MSFFGSFSNEISDSRALIAVGISLNSEPILFNAWMNKSSSLTGEFMRASSSAMLLRDCKNSETVLVPFGFCEFFFYIHHSKPGLVGI